MPRKPFRVGRSKTGLGLFATDEIAKGAFIVEYKGRLLPSKVAEQRENRYHFEVNSRWTVDGVSRRNIARYANHSCRPNAESDVTREKKVILRAIKKIRPGDEITYNYGRDYFNAFLKPIGCKCAACTRKPDRKRSRVVKGRSRAKSRARKRARPS